MKLTEREKEVVQMMANDLNVPLIAQKLRIASPTVEAHIYNLKKRNGLKTAAGVVAGAFREKLIS